jgi:hypothetical protein
MYNSESTEVYKKRRQEILDSEKRDEPLLVIDSLKGINKFVDFMTKKLDLRQDFCERFVK